MTGRPAARARVRRAAAARAAVLAACGLALAACTSGRFGKSLAL